MGFAISGFCSIIWGAVFSAAEAEDQENGVSVLVGSEYPESRYYRCPS